MSDASVRIVAALLAAGFAASCTGSIGAPGAPPSGPPSAGVAGPASPPGGGASVFVDQSPALVRLTNVEYSQTVADLLGEPADAAVRYRFPEDTKKDGFDNQVELLKISAGHAERYAVAAEAISRATLASAARRALVLSCDPGAGATCLQPFVQRLGRLLYRRPLADDEVASLLTLATAGSDPADADAGPRVVLEAMLQSPHFLYRVQLGGPVARRPDLVALGGYELATRLSFFLLGTAPDSRLLDRAEAGTLNSPEGIEATARELLNDPRARGGTRRFYGQWLPLTRLVGPDVSPTQLPRGSAALAVDMVEETGRFVDSVLLGGGSVLDLVTGRYTFVNGALAAIYGVAAPATGWGRVEFTGTTPRAGLLTQGSLLAATANNGAPSSTRRGQLVREAFLCGEIPSPPPGVANVPPAADPGETERETFDRHTTDVRCSVCHTLMDPIGWGLATFDGAGAFRDKDTNGQPISAKGTIAGLASPDFDGAVELAQKVGGSDLFKTCFATQLFRYVYGRHGTDEDLPGIQQLEAAFQASRWDFKNGVAALVRGDGFRFRLKGDAP